MPRHIIATSDTTMYLMTFFEPDQMIEVENLYISRTPIENYEKKQLPDGSYYHDRTTKDDTTSILCVEMRMNEFYTGYGPLWRHATSDAMRPMVGTRQPIGFVEGVSDKIMNDLFDTLVKNHPVRFDERQENEA